MGCQDINSREPGAQRDVAGLKDGSYSHGILLPALSVGTFEPLTVLDLVRLSTPAMRTLRDAIPPLLNQIVPASLFVIEFSHQIFEVLYHALKIYLVHDST